MKTLLTIVAICAALTTLSACTNNFESDIKPTNSALEINHPMENTMSTESPLEVNVDNLGPFQKGLSLDEMKFDEKYQDIVLLFQKNLTAWAAKDKKAFDESFISKDAADSHMFILEDPADYEFIGTPYIIDQSSENGRINIIFSYRTSKQIDEIQGNTMTFIKGEGSMWKISLID